MVVIFKGKIKNSKLSDIILDTLFPSGIISASVEGVPYSEEVIEEIEKTIRRKAVDRGVEYIFEFGHKILKRGDITKSITLGYGDGYTLKKGTD